MENKKTISVLTLALAITLGGYVNNSHELKENERIVEDLQDDIDTKSTEIAKLEVAIVERDIDLEATNKVIEEQNAEINKQKEETKKQKVEMKKANDQLKKSLNQIKKLKEDVEKARSSSKDVSHETSETSSNFNAGKEGSDVGRKVNVEMTAYIAQCKEGCTGITATGIDIRGKTTHQGHRVIATDPNVIPMHSIVKVETKSSSFTAIALDTGGAINGHIVDFLVGSTSEAMDFGRQNATITVLREGK